VVDLYYGGESVSSDQHQSYTCPHCGRLGFTDLLLLEHVGNEHADAAAEVVHYTVCHSSNVSKNRLDLVSTKDKHSDTPRDANGRGKTNGHSTAHDFNFNTI